MVLNGTILASVHNDRSTVVVPSHNTEVLGAGAAFWSAVTEPVLLAATTSDRLSMRSLPTLNIRKRYGFGSTLSTG